MSEAERVIGLYERHARAFDGIRSKHLFEKPWLDRFAANLSGGALPCSISAAAPASRWRTELLARGLAVTGVDSSETLIGLCRERFPSADWPRGRYAERSPSAGASMRFWPGTASSI